MSELRPPWSCVQPVPNAHVRKAGWCTECKERLDECECDESGDPVELDFEPDERKAS